jgi:hypothetical protein
MQNMAATILTAAIAAFPDGACSVRVGRDVIATALCTGLDEVKTATDQGNVIGFSGNVRYLLADEPREVKKGEVIEIKRAEDAAYFKVRAGVRHSSSGAVRLSITAEFE